MHNPDYKFTLDDLKLYDQQIYHSLKILVDTPMSKEEIEQIQINFCVEIYDEEGLLLKQHELIPEGANTFVNIDNK